MYVFTNILKEPTVLSFKDEMSWSYPTYCSINMYCHENIMIEKFQIVCGLKQSGDICNFDSNSVHQYILLLTQFPSILLKAIDS